MSYENFVNAQLAQAAAADAQTLTLSAVVAPNRLPPTGGGLLVLVDSLGKPTRAEIVTYASRTGQVLSGVVRAQEGTAALAWSAGAFVYQSLTAGEFASLKAKVADASRAMTPILVDTDLSALINPEQMRPSLLIGATCTVTLPALASVPVGYRLDLSKYLDAVPIIKGAGTEVIKTKLGSDNQIRFNINATLGVLRTTAGWEV